MVILSTSHLSFSFGERTLFSDISFDVMEGDKIGFIGVNGCGKTTLFKLITGKMKGLGQIHSSKTLRLGYVEQHVNSLGEGTAYSEALSAFAHVINTEEKLNRISEQLQAAQPHELEKLVMKQHVLQEQFESDGGLTYRSRTRSALLGLGVDEEMFSKPMSALSGGNKSKVLLARMLLSNANLLLLDEPTNHLDIEAIEWLENYLISFQGSAMIISHDRYFLDRVTNRTYEMQNGKLLAYDGNYSVFMQKKEKERDTEQKHYENTQKEIKRIEGIVAQQRQWNREKNIRTAESKEKQIERLKADLIRPDQDPSSIRFSFHVRTESGQDVLITDDLCKSFGENQVLNRISLHIRKGERVFLLGANGCGKSTLLKIIARKYMPDKGTFSLGANVHIGYYDQTLEELNLDKTVLDEVWDSHPTLKQTEIRNALAALLFRADDVFKPVSALSGGERARVSLVKLMLSDYNFLMLDEPTNHLDVASREMLEQTLLDYDGTQLIVSHDRYFVNKLATRILYLSNGGVVETYGNYEDYIARLKETNAQNKAAHTPVKETTSKENYLAEKERRSEQRRLITKRDKTEQTIIKTEECIAELEKKLCQEEIATDYQASMEIGTSLAQYKAELESLYPLWEELQEQCEGFEIS